MVAFPGTVTDGFGLGCLRQCLVRFKKRRDHIVGISIQDKPLDLLAVAFGIVGKQLERLAVVEDEHARVVHGHAHRGHIDDRRRFARTGRAEKYFVRDAAAVVAVERVEIEGFAGTRVHQVAGVHPATLIAVERQQRGEVRGVAFARAQRRFAVMGKVIDCRQGTDEAVLADEVILWRHDADAVRSRYHRDRALGHVQ